jgi:hypothetical protein
MGTTITMKTIPKHNRELPGGRHGGDIEGIKNLDYTFGATNLEYHFGG